MLAGSGDTILLFVGALVVVGGLLGAYILTRHKSALGHTENAKPPVTSHEIETAGPQEYGSHAEPREQEPANSDLTRGPIPTVPADDGQFVEDHRDLQLDSRLLALDPQLKHRIVYRFMPHLKGMLFEIQALDGYLADAVNRAEQRGWIIEDLISSANSGKWKKPHNKRQDLNT